MQRTTALTSILAAVAVIATAGGVLAQSPLDDTERPGAPRNVVMSNDLAGATVLDFDRSTDDTGIAEYVVLRNAVEWSRTGSADTDVRLTDLPRGVSYLQLVGVDLAGKESVRTAPLVAVRDTDPPPAPVLTEWMLVPEFRYAMDAPMTVVRFDQAADASGVERVDVLVNGRQVAERRVSLVGRSTDAAISLDLPGGTSWIQLVAVDGSGNSSVRSAPLRIDLPDMTPPPTPTISNITFPSFDRMVIDVGDDLDLTGIDAFDVLVSPPGRSDGALRLGVSPTTDTIEIDVTEALAGQVQLVAIGANQRATFGPFVDVESPAPTGPYPPRIVTTDVELGIPPLLLGTDVDGTELPIEVVVDGELIGVADGLRGAFPGAGEYDVDLTSVTVDGRRSRTISDTIVVGDVPEPPTPRPLAAIPETAYAAVDGDRVHLRFTPATNGGFVDRIDRYRIDGLPGGPVEQEVVVPSSSDDPGRLDPWAATIILDDVPPGTHTLTLTRMSALGTAPPSNPLTITVR